MKINFISLILILVLVSCKKDDNNNSAKVYSNTNGTSVSISDALWYTTNQSYSNGYMNGYSVIGVSLKLVGTTNGEKIKVKTFGDGLISYYDVKMDSTKNFNDTVSVSFLVLLTTAIPKDEFTKNTNLLVCKGTDTLNVALNSGKLKY
jgi:hypothetical protein